MTLFINILVTITENETLGLYLKSPKIHAHCDSSTAYQILTGRCHALKIMENSLKVLYFTIKVVQIVI